MSVLCIECSHLTSHGPEGKKMARQNFGGCSRQEVYVYFSLTLARDCAMFRPADTEKVLQRRSWLK